MGMEKDSANHFKGHSITCSNTLHLRQYPCVDIILPDSGVESGIGVNNSGFAHLTFFWCHLSCPCALHFVMKTVLNSAIDGILRNSRSDDAGETHL